MLDCKSRRAAVMICAILVNTQAHIHTHLRLQTHRQISPTSLASWFENSCSQTVRAPHSLPTKLVSLYELEKRHFIFKAVVRKLRMSAS